jgi:MSHA biogenesis protein MshJ
VKEQWQKLAERFNAFQPRERAIILIAVVAGTALIFDALAFQPAQARRKTLEQQIVQARQQLKTAEAILQTKQSVGDSHAVKRTYRDALQGRLAEIDQNIKGLQEGLVPPERMAKLLEGVLARTGGVQLLSLRALPPKRFESVEAAPAPKAGAQAAKPAPKESERTIYQHGFEVTLQGSYDDLYDYLARLEKLPWQMFWNRISVQAEQHPRLRMTLTVQTLSLTSAWLIV